MAIDKNHLMPSPFFLSVPLLMDLWEFREALMDNGHIKNSKISFGLRGDFIELIKFHCCLRPGPSWLWAL